MKTSNLLAVTAVAIALSVNNFALAKDFTASSVAVVDLQKIFENSTKVNALKAERKNKAVELATYMDKTQKVIAKESNASKKKTLEDNYLKEVNLRKDTINKDYIQKVGDIDREISAVIKSKATGYDLVLVRSSVLDGGVDITSEILKEIK